MSVDKSRITRLINSARRIEVVTLTPADASYQRQNLMRRMIDESVRTSNQRSVLIVSIEV
jgi:hypothetical protein